MAFSVNKAILVGNLGKDAEHKIINEKLELSRFSIATERSWKNKDGEWQHETTWHNIVAFNLSDFYKDGLKKGRKFYIEGRISKNEYTDKEGIKRYSTEVVAENLVPLEGKDDKNKVSYEGADNTRVAGNTSVKYQGVDQTPGNEGPDKDLPF
jgi:single-strand DNA-binding protein